VKVSKEFKVGLLAVITGAMMYYGFNYLKGSDLFSESNKYYAIYENIDGLQVSNPVIINGFTVGRVSSIVILQDQNNKVLVEMDVGRDVVLGDSTKALLYNVDFLGSKGVQLDIRQVNGVLGNGDTLDSDQAGGITEIAQNQIANLGITISRINDILLGLQGSGEEMKGSIVALRETLERINAAIDQNENKISETIDSFNTLTGEITSMSGKISKVLDNANASLDKVNKLEMEETLDNLQELLVNLNKTVVAFNESDGTISKLMTNDSLYNNMSQMFVDIDSLVNHLNQYPRHFMKPLGKKHKKILRDLEKEN